MSARTAWRTRADVRRSDLPAGPIDHHWTKNILSSRDGSKLYVSVGSNSNVGENGMENEGGRAAIRSSRGSDRSPLDQEYPVQPRRLQALCERGLQQQCRRERHGERGRTRGDQIVPRVRSITIGPRISCPAATAPSFM